ncbi:MAG: EpsG family protein [Gammaproteobacteria bacterium]|nr:EpsG family protein [Gammaproteobacteria bacterium]
MKSPVEQHHQTGIQISLAKAVMYTLVLIASIQQYLFLSANIADLGLSDLGIYQIQFNNIIKYNGLNNNTDVGFYGLMLVYGKYLSFELFVTTCFFIFYAALVNPFYRLSGVPWLTVILFCILYFYPMYQSLSSLVLRQGMGFAFLMIAGFYFNSHAFFISALKVVIAALFHLSLLFYLPVILVSRLISSLKLLVFFWCVVAVMYVLNIPTSFVSLLPGDLAGLVRAFSMIEDDYVLGFKPLFFALSIVPFLLLLIRPYYYYVAADKVMFEIMKIFFISNSAGLLFSGFPYYDRVMLFSWILVPLILVNFCGFIFPKQRSDLGVGAK